MPNHKKKLRAEKSKVKLKGAKLAKGLNVTKTEFKVRKITIRQQQQEELKYAEGQRIINVKETLNRLKAKSVGAKLEALRSLREAIENKQPEVRAMRATIVQNVAAMCLEIEKEPRRESLRTMAALLASLNATNDIAPFFHIISSHLRCAMTHINQSLQEDSLLLLDVLLKYNSEQVAVDSARILQNFLEMISRVRAEGDQAGRTLLTHVKNTQTAVKWRSKVLQRLQQMLEKLVTHNATRELANKNVMENKQDTRIINFNARQPQYYALKRPLPCIFDYSGLFTVNFNVTTNETIESVVQKEANALRTYIQHLLPLLLESWMEVRPQQTNTNAQIFLNNDAAITLQIILDIMICLWTLVQQHEELVKNNELSLWFRKQYALMFANNFIILPQFPYQQLPSSLAKKKTKNVQSTNLKQAHVCLRQNLCLVHLMCLFYNDHKYNKKWNDEHKTIFHELIVFLNNIVKNISNHVWTSSENYQILIHALRDLLLTNVTQLLPNHAEHMLKLLESLLEAYLLHKIPSTSGLQSDVLVLLCEIAESPELLSLYGGQKQFEGLLQQLPLLLLKPSISERALLAMTRLGKQLNATFLQALEAQITAVIKNMQRIQVSNAVNALEGRKQIINLFYWTQRKWRLTDDEQELLKLIEMNVKDKRIANYMQFVLFK